MSGSFRFTILGCGNSAGVPAIGGYWGQCDPAEPRNRRTRASAMIQDHETTLIIDTGPDFSQQLTRSGVQTVDAVLYTHAHGDHIHGIDELRVLSGRASCVIPAYGSATTLNELCARFSYMFEETSGGLYRQVLEPRVIPLDARKNTVSINTLNITCFDQDHGTCRSLGVRIGDVAYSTDMIGMPEESYEALRGIKVWIVDAAGYKQTANYVHATLRQVIEMNRVIGAEQVYLTHLPAYMDYQTLLDELPPGFAPAYDGLVIEG